ncbi:MAG TPA: hypothetical protein VFA75_09170 [Nevskia sp.]|nr:hypothetical protein [Nevskia sp.]
MSIPASPEVLSLKEDLLESMTGFMRGEDEEDEGGSGFEAGYTQDDIDRCAAIIDHFLITLSKTGGDGDAILEAVKDTVLELNTLNDNCDGSLIETDQRETLCELINTAAQDAGLETDLDDVTEEWREW